MLRRLHVRHEIHFVALHDGSREALDRSSEYCSKAWPVPYALAPRSSARFWLQTAQFLFSELPVVVARKRSQAAEQLVEKLLREQNFDLVVCDFLTPTVHLPPMQPFVLLEHNVETVLWRRYTEQAANPAARLFFRLQAQRMLRFECEACRRANKVIAVSEADAATLREMCGISHIFAIPTGVDAAWFARPHAPGPGPASDLIFVGSMDWLPNIDGVRWFVGEVLPRIRDRLPHCSLTVAGRRPPASIRDLATTDARIRVTGTVDDIRPYLWAASVSVVPLRIGGGTRLKIYEAMAAGIPVVATTIGAEGLDVSSPENVCIADTADALANACVELLNSPSERARQAAAAAALVRDRFSWENVAARFEEIVCSGRV